MQTQDITQTLSQIFEDLTAEGKKPTTALVKSRLPFAVPMPAIITALKTWQKQSHVPKVEIAAQTEPKDTDEQIQMLQQQLDEALKNLALADEKIAQLDQRITQLESK